MAVAIIREEKTANKPIVTVACDTEDEMSALTVTGWSATSRCYVMDSTDGVSEYMLNPSGDWCISKVAPNATEGE